jgi:hypothetical protein
LFHYGWMESVDPGILYAIPRMSGYLCDWSGLSSLKNCVGLAMNKNSPYKGEKIPHFLTIF